MFRPYVPLMVVVSVFGLFGRTGDAFAGRMLSPSEISLMEFKKERDDLVKNRTAEKNQRVLKNKITILDNKIAYLQGRIKRVKPYVVEQRLVPADPALEPSSAAQPSSVEPVAVPWRERAGREAPGRPMLAWTPNAAELKPRAGSEARVSASPEASFKPASRPQTRLAPFQARAALPVLPQSAAPAEKRAGSQELALSVKPQSKGHAAKTGADWKKMTRMDKEIYILSVMGSLSRRDVYLMKPYNYYIQAIDQAVEKNPRLEQEFVHRILMMRAYDSEPDARKDLEKIWK